MNTPLQILYLEDSPRDAELVRDLLGRSGLACDLQIVANRADYTTALERARYDLILSDYALPDYNGMAALALAREKQPGVPFILLSGTLGEEQAVDCMLQGVTDYVLKQRLERLAPAVRRALAEAEEQRKRKRAEEALRDSEARYRALVETTCDWIWEVDTEGRYTYVSPKVQEILGYSPAEILGRTPFELMPAEEAGRVTQIFRNIADTREPFSALENINRHKDCRLVALETSGVPVFGPDGQFRGYRGMDRDVTERKKAEAALRESERKHRTLFEGSRDAIIIADPKTYQFLFCNPAAVKIFAASSDADLLALGPAHFSPERQANGRLSSEILPEQAAAALEKGLHFFEWKLRRLNGEEFPADVLLAPIEWDNQPVLMATIRDITERRRAEAALRQNEAEFRAIFELASIGMAQADPATGQLLRVNRKMCEITGYTEGELLRLRAPELTHPDDRAKAQELLQLVVRGQAPDYRLEKRYLRKDGTPVWVNVNLTVIRNPDGRALRTMATVEDITEKKQLATQFLRAQRLESLGALAGGIAHDLNNILAPVLMVSQLLRDSTPDAEYRAMVDTVEKSAQRGADIIKQLLTFARGQPEQRVPLPLRHLLRDMENFVRETFPRDIESKVRGSTDLWTALGDPTQIHQVLLNLCVNARDAMPKGGTLTLEVRNVMVNEALAVTTPDARPGPHICLSVMDTGTGITPEVQDRIFDPFFTTKEIGKGTGLGLATVLGIVRGHEGFIRINTRVGQGTTFELYLPASVQTEAVTPEPPKRSAARGRGELILVVDDEPAVREGMRRTLEKNGYRMLAASQGEEGLAAFCQQRAQIAAVVTDAMMPVMGGAALVKALRSLAPELPVIVMTGLAELQTLKDLDELGAAMLLHKPFSRDELLEAIHKLLDSASPPAAI